MQDITMPRLSDSMEEGKVLRWLKRPGDSVAVGEVLLEVETDKADMEIEATEAGVLREIRLAEGETGPVGTVIATLDEPGAAAGASAGPPSAATGGENSGAETGENSSTGLPADEPRGTESVAPPLATDNTAELRAAGETANPPGQGMRTVRVSPLARTRAAELGIDPEALRGTGPGGRVTRQDVEDAGRGSGSPAREGSVGSGRPRDETPSPGLSGEPTEDAGSGEPTEDAGSGEPGATAGSSAAGSTVVVRPPARGGTPPPSLPDAEGAVRRIPLSGMRASIARRMAESKREAPHFYVRSIADMEFAVRLRAALRERGDAVTYNHIVLKACADALAAVPELNARFVGDAIELLPDVNLGVVTALPDGVIVPVIHGADRLGLLELASRARALAEKARERNFSAEDLSGATFSVSNLGMYEVEDFVAVINPPQAAILAVGTVAQRPVVRGGAVAAAHTLHLTLSCDHRAIDGAKAAEFLQEVRERLQNPLRLLMPRE
jgi:pyruvate dehydrogenase E2 component (dihydrolipoamide acetyltransferase)